MDTKENTTHMAGMDGLADILTQANLSIEKQIDFIKKEVDAFSDFLIEIKHDPTGSQQNSSNSKPNGQNENF